MREGEFHSKYLQSYPFASLRRVTETLGISAETVRLQWQEKYGDAGKTGK
jgi:hypothetical protein